MSLLQAIETDESEEEGDTSATRRVEHTVNGLSKGNVQFLVAAEVLRVIFRQWYAEVSAREGIEENLRVHQKLLEKYRVICARKSVAVKRLR